MIAASRDCRMPHVACRSGTRFARFLEKGSHSTGARDRRARGRKCEGRPMALPIPFDYAPMNARLVDEIPSSGRWQYEPKWDGFRCLAFRDGTRVELRSKSGQPLGRY